LSVRDLFFYALCAAMLALAGVTVLARNLFRASLGLLGVLLGTAALFLLLRAEMSALVQIMVYIGGILIFVLYAVLLTSELGGRMTGPSPAKIAMALAAAVAAFAYLGRLAWSVALAGGIGPGPSAATFAAPLATPLAAPLAAPIAALKPLGARLLDPGQGGFLLPFELVSALLLAALVGAIAIARGGRAGPHGVGGPGVGGVGGELGRPQAEGPAGEAAIGPGGSR
jgi:NADH-quinone oxidoreductase subunit J